MNRDYHEDNDDAVKEVVVIIGCAGIMFTVAVILLAFLIYKLYVNGIF